MRLSLFKKKKTTLTFEIFVVICSSRHFHFRPVSLKEKSVKALEFSAKTSSNVLAFSSCSVESF